MMNLSEICSHHSTLRHAPFPLRPEARKVSSYTLVKLYIERLRNGWRQRSPEEHFLAAAADHADLERRMRVLERGRGEANFVLSRD